MRVVELLKNGRPASEIKRILAGIPEKANRLQHSPRPSNRAETRPVSAEVATSSRSATDSRRCGGGATRLGAPGQRPFCQMTV